MNKVFSRVVSLGILAAVIISTIGYPVYATIEDERSELNRLEQQRKEVQSTIAGLQGNVASIEANIEKLDAQYTKVSKQLYKTERKLEKVKKKIKKNKKKLKKAKKSIKEQYAAMKLRIQYMYENGNQEMITLIMGSESIGDFLNKAEYITELSSYDRKMMDKMIETKNTIVATQKELEKQKSSLVALKKEQKQDKEDIELLVAEKQRELEAYSQQILTTQGELYDLEGAIGDQQAVISEMERIEKERAEQQRKEEESRRKEQQAQNSGGNSSGGNNQSSNNSDKPTSKPVASGSFGWPLPGYSHISSGFGTRSDPFTGQTTTHHGIDLPAPSGTAIVAPASGQVAWANRSVTAGNWIGIDHGNGVYTVYMHMSALLVSPGQNVSPGQTIGLVGTTGSSTGNHLHFEVRKNGAFVNPLGYVGK